MSPTVAKTQEIPNTQGGLRIRFVSEINQESVQSSPEVVSKRKLPAWMITASDTPKKVKTHSTSSNCETNENSLIESPHSDKNNPNSQSDPDSVPSTSNINRSLDENSAGVNPADSVNANHESETSNVVDNSSESKILITLLPEVKKETDIEADTSQGQATSSDDTKPVVEIKKEEATSTTRECCKYGIRCYRKNPLHRAAEAHPGDEDYRRPNYPSPSPETPSCPFGNLCYRRNPMHFQEYSHPRETDFSVNCRNNQIQKARSQKNIVSTTSSSSSEDDEDEVDPFLTSGDEDENFEFDDFDEELDDFDDELDDFDDDFDDD